MQDSEINFNVYNVHVQFLTIYNLLCLPLSGRDILSMTGPSVIQVCTLTHSHVHWESSNLCINAYKHI
jgi:hypothetical protein